MARLCISTLLLAAATLMAATPEEIFKSIRGNDLQVLKNLSDVNVADGRGTTPLHTAAAYGSVEAVRVLLDKGAQVNAKNAMGATPLILGAMSDEKVRLLLAKGADVKERTKAGRTALMIAVSGSGTTAAVRLLLNAGSDVNAEDERGTNVLNIAALYSDLETVRLLVAAGAKVEAPDKAGFTALHGAASSGDLLRMRLLLDKGANPNAANVFAGKVKNGDIALVKMTPLIMAASYAPVDFVRELIQRGANVNVQDGRGQTPLMAAVSSENQDLQVVKLLIASGADVHAKDQHGATVLDWARRVGNPAIIKALVSAGAKGSPIKLAPVRQAPPATTKEAIEKSAALLKTSSAEFFKQSGCVGCHHQPLMARAYSALHRGDDARDELARGMNALRPLEPMLVNFIDPGGDTDSVSSSLMGFAAAGLPSSSLIDAGVSYIAGRQQANGSWTLKGISRAPSEESDIMRTAWAVTVLQAYGWPARKPEFDQRVARARAWLLKAEPRTSYERAYLLLGLHWSGAERQDLARVARGLLGEQRADGGWAQNKHRASDAYATGLALHALTETGLLRATAAAYRRGAEYLLKTQLEDGSWYVRSRAPKFQPYFQSGFPHDHDQWISAAATAYAVMGLAPSLVHNEEHAHSQGLVPRIGGGAGARAADRR